MPDSIINTKLFKKCREELENSIKLRCVEPFSTEDYINAMEDIITRTRTVKSWTRRPMVSKIFTNTSREDRRPEIPVSKFHKCRRNSKLANTCTKKAKIN
ncbi:hypothetical protein O181_000787 [Austropuccinia psidii MF-1]|uniref:Uncharacterized protein n=1 Tax=Austropuccinia psidii MF-1 TaxID=1389203 RepID=A0A9Q3B9J9_9BASI|nr:hypothetical protein [Austropuccinia psidii MF-1]